MFWKVNVMCGNMETKQQEKFECMDCGCYFWVDDRNDFECPNCNQIESDINKQGFKINRVKSPPNKDTFTIKPIRELLKRYVNDGKNWADPFSGENSPAEFTNDLNKDKPTKYHMEALEFCKIMKDNLNGILLDPPYSPRQIKECYESFGIRPDGNYTQASFYWDIKKAIAHKIKPNGLAITFGWNSCGFGKQLGFEIIEILLVCHSGNHNDTIVTVERKVQSKLQVEEAKD